LEKIKKESIENKVKGEKIKKNHLKLGLSSVD
jgi:hypothetical protein